MDQLEKGQEVHVSNPKSALKIEGFIERDSVQYAQCVWFDGKKTQRGEVPVSLLKVGAPSKLPAFKPIVRK